MAAHAHVTGVGLRVDAHNAEGDRYDTDGELTVVTLPPANAPVTPAPPLAPDPPLVALKERWWARWHHTPPPAATSDTAPDTGSPPTVLTAPRG